MTMCRRGWESEVTISVILFYRNDKIVDRITLHKSYNQK